MISLFLKNLFLSENNEKEASRIASYIRRGAYAFLREEYRIIFLVAVMIAAIIWHYLGTTAAASFLFGAFLSLFVGFIGMSSATKANLFSAIAAKKNDEKKAFFTAIFGGGVMGFAVASFGLLGLSSVFLFFILYGEKSGAPLDVILSSFSIGASLVAFFARVGGGIYTKSADVGADLVGKIESGIPEDDIRNPAVIADNVGDCVGDTAGMGADVYESYISSMVSAILLGIFHHPKSEIHAFLPMIISGIGTIASIFAIGIMMILPLSSKALLRSVTLLSVLFFTIMSYCAFNYLHISSSLFGAVLVGCISGIVIGAITEYYTGSSPIKKLAKSCESGAATNIIYGLSIGMESTVLPVILLAIAVQFAYYFGESYGVAIAAVAMLATVAIVMTIDGYGPIADTAGGIAEMASFGKKAREITDKLDSLGNTTAAVGKGFAIGSALLSALGVFAAYAARVNFEVLDLLNIQVLVGLFIGSTVPFLISALTMRSVGNAALEMVAEVRRQFKEITGLMEGKAEPDYEKCVQISTRASIREMILPGCIAIISPVLIKLFLGKFALGGFLVGATASGILLSLFLANGGGAWDNAKKYIEAGNFGGKGSPCHAAAVIGDTVGDPCKDTSGPANGILVKLMSMIALVLS